MLTWQADRRAGAPRLLALGAHADDIEIGCGGSVLSLIAQQPALQVTWVVFGARGHREAEARASAQAFCAGAAALDVQVFDHPDGQFPQDAVRLKQRFEALKAQVQPDLIFTHALHDRHQDHRQVAEMTWATWRAHTVLEYEIPKYDGDLQPTNLYVPLTEAQAQRKVDLLLEHFASQRERHWFTADLFLAAMRLRGIESPQPTRHAEGFHARKLALGWPAA
jgi:LmbE family N-acetylglucosaminyl deacetylase